MEGNLYRLHKYAGIVETYLDLTSADIRETLVFSVISNKFNVTWLNDLSSQTQPNPRTGPPRVLRSSNHRAFNFDQFARSQYGFRIPVCAVTVCFMAREPF